MQIDYSDTAAAGSATLDDVDRLYDSPTEAIEHGTLQGHLEPAPVIDLDAGMQHLASLVELLPPLPPTRSTRSG